MDKPITVTQLNLYLKKKINMDQNLNNLYIQGEISNYKKHFTGHLYFNIKDQNTVVKCLMFSNSTKSLNFEPKEGDNVEIKGKLDIYPANGSYQIYVNEMVLAGAGQLYLKLEELKKELAEKGYFDENIKKAIPKFPRRIGVVTSETGSVIKDIINVGTSRNPNLDLLLYPVHVQGNEAKTEIAEGIKYFNTRTDIDVLIIGRGGGSIEDLWAFNEIEVINAIYNSKIPIISAVGHETDFTISDFVADKRAATPSQAAEFAVPEIVQYLNKIAIYKKRNEISINKKIQLLKKEIEIAKHKLKTPESILNEKRLFIDKLCTLNINKLENKLSKIKNKLNININNIKSNYGKHEIKILQNKKDVLNYKIYIQKSLLRKLENIKLKNKNIQEKIQVLSPENIFKRGFSVIKKNNNIIKNATELKTGDKIEILLANGEKEAIIS